MKILSLLAGFIAAEAFSIYAIFIAHTLKPITFYLVEQAHSGVGGKYQETFHFDGLISTLLGSLMMFTLVWLGTRGMAWRFMGTKLEMSRVRVASLKIREFSRAGSQRTYVPPLSGLPRPAIA